MRANKGQLVSQHLENISRTALENYQGILKEYVKGRHGVYALYSKGHLYYVGLASNLRNRLKSHLTDRHAQTWDSFSVYLTINDSHLHELETLILKIASPKGNRISGNFIKAENLKPIFKKAVTKAQQKELVKLGLKKIAETVKPKVTGQKGFKAVLTPYVKDKFEIRFWYKSKLYKATVRKDGTIFYKGKIYNSPSTAAAAITGRAMNGWTTWRYECFPGDWVVLDVLRRK
ncbi:MAG: GIY-YIG catalytic domain protein [Smithella sp. PtaU1.Bin162]|nr:MAG: GIY-YIG catalytic domain protein [Smithella sp. PtaU1.Bin162]